MSSDNNKWSRPVNPPPPLFFGKKERDLQKQVNDELTECVIGQQILYYPISLEHTNYHSLYGEALKKTFYPPIRVYCLIDWHGSETTSEKGLVDRVSSITIHFSKKRLGEDQNIRVNEGDFVKYGDNFYEIVSLSEPTELFGQTQHKVEISAECIYTRESVFDAK